MARFISLLNFTDQGARSIDKSPDRAREFADSVQAQGIKVLSEYWTTGPYDGVLILESDDKTKALNSLTRLAQAGNVRTETMEAFDADEFRAIVG